MILEIRKKLLLNLKNISGWRTNRKIVAISVDDYGNVRLDSKLSREKMVQAGLKPVNNFDAFDALETRVDLEMLYEALSSVKDVHGNPAMFTPFAVPCNIDFEKMAEEDYHHYHYEILPRTFEKLASSAPEAYNGTWDLWKQGIANGLMVPQFHGREHLNLRVFEDKLAKKNKEVLVALKNRSYSCITNTEYPTISYTAAFEFFNLEENEKFKEIIDDGLNVFEKIFGYKATHFNSPGGREHPIIHSFLKANGIKYLDVPLIKKEHIGKGKYKTTINYTGKRNHLDMIYEVRNVVFEPTDNQGIDWINFTIKQIEAAFRWNRPAIISSHRVNYCGHIDPKNRSIGINALKGLLQRIVQKWPDVEFMSSNSLGDLISTKQ